MNLAQTQAQWTKFVRELAIFLAVDYWLEESRRRVDPRLNREQTRESNNVNGFTSNWRVSGGLVGSVVGTKTGNLDELATGYVRITDNSGGAGHSLVEVFKAPGGGGSDKVMTGTGLDNTTFTLASANGSGLTALVDVGVVTASEADDKHTISLQQDWPLRARNIFDGSEPEHPALNDAFEAMCLRIQNGFVLMQGFVATALLAFWLGRGRRFLKSSQPSPMSAKPSVDQGAVSVAFRGIVEDMRKDMVDELTAVVQYVLKTAVTAGAGVFSASNQGKGAMSAPSMYEWALPGPLALTCTSDVIGNETFSLSQIVDVTGQVINADRSLTINRMFSDATLGIQGMLLTRTYALAAVTVTGSLAQSFATVSDYAITGESPNNTAAGVFSLKVRAGTIDPTKWVTEFYKDSTYVQSSLVGHSNEGAAGAVVAINFDNSSAMGGTCKIGSSPTAGDTATLNLQTFKAQNANGVADQLTVTVTVASFGVIQREIGRRYGYRLNSTTSGSETLPDSLVTSGTYAPFSVLQA